MNKGLDQHVTNSEEDLERGYKGNAHIDFAPGITVRSGDVVTLELHFEEMTNEFGQTTIAIKEAIVLNVDHTHAGGSDG